MKRFLLLIVTNLAIMLVLGIVVSVLGVDRFFVGAGLDLGKLLVFSAIIGFGGAYISLLMSKWMAKMSVGAQVIESPRDEVENWLVNTVRRQAEKAGIGMPEVAIYDSPEINAFATGANRNNALVAVSTGLLRAMNRDEAEAVLGHEISHVANGDMVTLTLIQGVVNTFVVFLSRIVGYLVDQALRGNRDEESSGPGMGYFIASFVAQILLGILASMVVAWFSRRREYLADAGGADLAGRQKMIAALERLAAGHGESQLPDQMAAFGISGKRVASLFMSHPPLEERIAALKARAQ
jgi:heat shock protein HtpX